MARPTEPLRRRLRWLLLATGISAPMSSVAQPILHEPLSVPRLRCKDGVCRPDGASSDAMPDAVMSRDGLVTAPSGGRAPIGQEQIFASGATTENLAHSQGPQPGTDPPPVRRSRILPDSATGPETGGERLYHEVFAPAVYPYKRMSVLDGVDDDGAMKLRRSDLVAVPVEKTGAAPGRDPFYGSVVVDFVAGQAVPLPTPAAGFRILSYRSTPTRRLSFFVDVERKTLCLVADRGPPSLGLFDGCRAALFCRTRCCRRGHQRRCSAMPDDLIAPLPRSSNAKPVPSCARLALRTSSGSDYQALLARAVPVFAASPSGNCPTKALAICTCESRCRSEEPVDIAPTHL
ncbi:MAG: hypothetical protein U0787_23080 [Polyangia bacterium]